MGGWGVFRIIDISNGSIHHGGRGCMNQGSEGKMPECQRTRVV